MLKNTSRAQWVGGWIFAVIAMMAGSVVAGAHITISTGALWLVVGVVPPGVMLVLWHRAPPVTVAELLYSVNRQTEERRP